MVFKRFVCSLAFFTLSLFSGQNLFANFSKNELHQIFTKELKFKKKAVDKIVAGVVKDFGVDEAGDLKINGVLTSNFRFNASLFYNFNKQISLNAHLKDPKTGKVHWVKKAFFGHLSDHGVKVSLAAQKLFFFIPSDVSVKELDGLQLGTGVESGLPYQIVMKALLSIPLNVGIALTSSGALAVIGIPILSATLVAALAASVITVDVGAMDARTEEGKSFIAQMISINLGLALNIVTFPHMRLTADREKLSHFL